VQILQRIRRNPIFTVIPIPDNVHIILTKKLRSHPESQDGIPRTLTVRPWYSSLARSESHTPPSAPDKKSVPPATAEEIPETHWPASIRARRVPPAGTKLSSVLSRSKNTNELSPIDPSRRGAHPSRVLWVRVG